MGRFILGSVVLVGLLGIPSLVEADAADWKKVPADEMDVHGTVIPCLDICGVPGPTGSQYQDCCVSCVTVLSAVAKKTVGYVAPLLNVRIIGSAAGVILMIVLLLNFWALLSRKRLYGWTWYLGTAILASFIVVTLAQAAEFMVLKDKAGLILGADKDLRKLTKEGLIPTGSRCADVACFDMIGTHGVLKGKCAEGPLWQYPGAFTSFDDAGDVKTADTGHWAHEIKQRAEDARKLIQKENVKLDENASSEIPGEVWKSNPLLDSVAGERMSIFHHEITMPTIIVVAGVLIAWLVSLVHSFRRKRGHKDDIRSHVGA